MANYADDATPCTADRKVADVINSFEKFAKLLFKWFCDNFEKLWKETDKSHLLFNMEAALVTNINGNIICNSKVETLGVTVDHQPNFDGHLSWFCKKKLKKKSFYKFTVLRSSLVIFQKTSH